MGVIPRNAKRVNTFVTLERAGLENNTEIFLLTYQTELTLTCLGASSEKRQDCEFLPKLLFMYSNP